jgi:hypothetical protein
LRQIPGSVRWRERACECGKNVFVNAESRAKEIRLVKRRFSLAWHLPVLLLPDKNNVVQALLLALDVQCAFLLLTALSTSNCWNVSVEVKTNG